MADYTAPRTPETRSYQEQLAHSLLDCLGWEEAVHACQANTWDGVLDVLLAQRKTP
jgi:hypothetical protein